ncbi:MAG: endopeptidase La [Anaerolineae bacterium]
MAPDETEHDDAPTRAAPPEVEEEADLILDDSLGLPEELPILPLRGLVVYPETTIPLIIGQPRSIKLVDEVALGERMIGMVAAKDPDQETPGPEDIYTVGTIAAVHRLFRAPDGTIRLLAQGMARMRVEAYTQSEPYLRARIVAHPEKIERSLEVEALMRNLVDQFTHLADLTPSIPSELVTSAMNLEDPLQLVYSVATYVRLELSQAQKLLEIDNLEEKMRVLMVLVGKELEVLELGRKIQTEAQSEIEKVQREYYLREQLKAIQRELGEGDEQTIEVEDFRKKIEAARMPEEAHREALREVDRLSRLPTAAAEYGVIRTYLDWLVNLPWDAKTGDNLDVAHAREVLDEDHYGLEDVKERILEYLAVRKLRAERADERAAETFRDHVRREREGVILCFVGPPGVGKTSLGISIARAMGRKFNRLSLGGVRDEAEIRGFRRTYVGAMPGRIVQTLRRVESKNPLIMLDEVDKLGRDFRGDPASALLEVLDPEQNREFRDHYLDVAFDLSEVMFITTANQLEPIPGPLRDRMEIIAISGYTENEKVQIARFYLIPRQIRENGLRPDEVRFSEGALVHIIRDHTREAGVRELERRIGQVCRKIATRVAEHGAAAGEGAAESAGGADGGIVIDDADAVRAYLGRARFGYQVELQERTDLPGVATGLVWTPAGGDVIFVEATAMPGAKGFELTGQLGEVMQESARAAYSFIRAKARDLGLPEDFFQAHDIHLHVPAGAVPKDGPSAGVTMATALASLLSGRPVRHNVAMTGELTLRGLVLPVGGVKDKVLAAHRLGIDTIILPRRNAPDLDDVPEEVRASIHFVLVDRVDEALEAALEAALDAPQPAGKSARNAARDAARDAAGDAAGDGKTGKRKTRSASSARG